MIHTGDCIEVMATMPEASIDAIVTDPPYGLGFMGKQWDDLPPGPEFAEQAFRVLKPGGHILAFGGTRTYHRLACAIEDAGFEIRDSISWQHMEHVFCRCDALPCSHESISRKDLSGVPGAVGSYDQIPSSEEQDLRPEGMQVEPDRGRKRGSKARAEAADELDLPGVRDGVSDSLVPPEAGQDPDLLAPLQRETSGNRTGEAFGEHEGPETQAAIRGKQPGVEGRSDDLPQKGELRRRKVCPSAGMGEADGSEGRIHHGAPAADGGEDRAADDADGGGSPPRSQSAEQRPDESGTMAHEWLPSGSGGWPGCRGCGKPLEPPFYGGPLAWNYGSGFPKSHDVSKGIDKAAGAEREVVERIRADGKKPGKIVSGYEAYGLDATKESGPPITPEAQKWEGWGTALKPAHEPIIVARKPLIGTVAKNVTEHGTGALNIDGCRVRLAEGEAPYEYPNGKGGDHGPVSFIPANDFNTKPLSGNPQGRWPANVLLDPEAGAMLDAQSGELQAGAYPKGPQGGGGSVYGNYQGFSREERTNLDAGGASRFFYCAKSSAAERSAGLGGFEERAPTGADIGGGRDRRSGTKKNPRPRESSPKRNHHPTVKPINLMRYLVRLVTPPDGTVLDPFTGSGTTGIAAHLEGFDFIGIEREAEYAEIAEARIAWWSQHEGDTKDILKQAKKQKPQADQLDLAA